MTEDKQLRLERFAAGLQDGKPDARTVAWMQAMNLGFHEEPMPDAGLLAMTGAFGIDGRTLTGVYDDDVPELSLNPQYPVGTYGSLAKTLNTGDGHLLQAHLITAVTVRPSHRRRGILRRMITEDLALAKDNGLAIAATTPTSTPVSPPANGPTRNRSNRSRGCARPSTSMPAARPTAT